LLEKVLDSVLWLTESKWAMFNSLSISRGFLHLFASCYAIAAIKPSAQIQQATALGAEREKGRFRLHVLGT